MGAVAPNKKAPQKAPNKMVLVFRRIAIPPILRLKFKSRIAWYFTKHLLG